MVRRRKTFDASMQTADPRPIMSAGLLFIAALCVLFVSWLDPALSWPGFFNHWEPWRSAALNALPAFLLSLCLLALTRRILLSGWLTLLIVAALYILNRYKLEQLATPLLPEDVHFLRELGVSFSLFVHYLVISPALLMGTVAILAITVALCFEPPLARLKGWRWGALALTAIVSCASLVHGVAPWKFVYSSARQQFQPWSPSETAGRTGLLTNMVLLSWELGSPRIDSPDRSAAASLLTELGQLPAPERLTVAANVEPDAALPDIVVVQSESLFDPARLAGAGEVVYLPNYHRLAREGWSGELRVPTYGGGTIRTEFEVLTGLGLDAFPRVRYPYLELTRRQMPGLVRVLRQQGYRTVAIHPNSGAFWNRNRMFRSMGFDRFVDVREFPREVRTSWFVSDQALTDRILTELQDEGPPQFILAISLQNHGPYVHRKDIDPDRAAAMPLPAGLPEGGAEELRNYLVLAQDADRELGRLADALRQRKRRTLLLFYGDHLPALGAAFFELGFADGRSPFEQTVPWLLLDNRASGGRRENIHSWQLPGLLISVAGMDGGRYFDVLEAFRHRWSLEGLVDNEDLRQGLTALTQLAYKDALESLLPQQPPAHFP